ncbi:hypothetical protein [Peristeroidobacter agariperforans]|uniref:hypothetical protein n=1 Tax=Peristeroidobacter agariperforans TaxID=268404 RepID=UPI00101D1F31|nr:hypothetical protein [Peristeroidobacter agariperforans]
MTQLRRDAAYIRIKSPTSGSATTALTAFDEQVCEVLASAHTVTSAAKTLANASAPAAGRDASDQASDLESRVAASMLRLLQAERIELSPDS